jgi:hypothetical protein
VESAAIHHVAGSDQVCAGTSLGDGGAREKLERCVVVYGSLTQDAAVTVAGVFAQAEVGNDDELG